MLLILTNTTISKYYFLCLNPCLDTHVNKFYVKIRVIKHKMDPNSYLSSSRKTPSMSVVLFSAGSTLVTDGCPVFEFIQTMFCLNIEMSETKEVPFLKVSFS